MVNAFVVTAEQDDILFEREFVGDGLAELFAVRREIYDFIVMPFGLQFGNHLVQGLHHHHHSGISTVAVVVHLLVRALAVFARVVDIDFHDALADGTAYDGVGERTLQQLGNDGYDVDAHNSFYFRTKIGIKRQNQKLSR